MNTLLKTTGLTKDFGHGKGVFDVDLAVNAGEIVGFVGPNGSGKSTTINMLAGLVKADAGSIELFGHEISPTNIHHYMPRIGLLLSESTLDRKLTAAKTFRQSQQLLGYKQALHWQSMSKTLSLDINKTIKKLSLGNTKKVGVINALLHQPQLVIMDEPTSGLDPIIQDKFGQLLKDQTQQGGAVFLSSHDLNEVQTICDRIIMIKEGKIILSGRTDELLEKASKVFTLKGPSRTIISSIHTRWPNLKVEHKGDQVLIYTPEYREMIELLAKQKFYDFFLERPTLEETFKEYYE